MQPFTVALIALGGAVGTALRYAIAVDFAERLGAQYPFGTLTVNVVGSAALGFVAEALAGQTVFGVEARLVLGVGLLGGFTTYSSFNLELLRMVEQQAFMRAAGYLAGTLFGCLVAGAGGIALARALLHLKQT